jgi:hypothetical protein
VAAHRPMSGPLAARLVWLLGVSQALRLVTSTAPGWLIRCIPPSGEPCPYLSGSSLHLHPFSHDLSQAKVIPPA